MTALPLPVPVTPTLPSPPGHAELETGGKRRRRSGRCRVAHRLVGHGWVACGFACRDSESVGLFEGDFLLSVWFQTQTRRTKSIRSRTDLIDVRCRLLLDQTVNFQLDVLDVGGFQLDVCAMPKHFSASSRKFLGAKFTRTRKS